MVSSFVYMNLFYRVASLICIFLFQWPCVAQKQYQGLLWEISGNGLQKSSYLYGTMHVSEKKAYHLSDSFFIALSQVDVVGLETNPDQWLKNMKDIGMLEAYNNPNTNLNTDFYREAFKLNIPDNVRYSEILAQEPLIINGLLYRTNEGYEDYEESTYLDLYIYQTGTRLNKTIVSLENFKTSLIMTGKGSINYPRNRSTDNNPKINLHHIRVGINDAYRYEDLDQLDSLMHLTYATKYTQKYLIDDRNEIMAHHIDSICRSKSLFAGVGAAHLPGKKGIIEILRKKGYTVRAVASTTTKSGSKIRKRVDRLEKTRPSIIQYADDSLYSFNLFEKPILIASLKGYTYHLTTDMSNGAYYSICRQMTYGSVINHSPEKLSLKIDSLLYEGVPGKILSKKHFVDESGIIGIDVLNKTIKGDLQRYKIYFTETEMIIFKMSGKENYVEGNEAKRFFNSIHFRLKKNQSLISFFPATKGFSVSIPPTYHYTNSKRNYTHGLAEELFAYDKSSNTCRGVMHYYYNDFTCLEEDSFELRLLAEHTLKNFGYATNIQLKLATEQHLPCVFFSAENKELNKSLYAKLVINGVHYYLVYELIDKSREITKPDDFINSFQIIDFKHIYPMRLITDDDLGFTVVDEIMEGSNNQIQESLLSFYHQLEDENKPKTMNEAFNFDSGTKTYYSPTSGEHISIERTKYNDYDYRDSMTFWNDIKTHIRSNSTFTISHAVLNKCGNRETLEMRLSDKGSARVIKRQYILEGGTLFCLSAVYDSTRGLTLWTDSFFKSFRHKAPDPRKSIFKNKIPELLTDLTSKDSSKRYASRQSLGSFQISLHKKNAEELLSFLKSPEFFKVNEATRAVLLFNTGNLRQEAFIPVFKSLYNQYEDSSFIQMAILNGLGYLKTQKSSDTFLELLKTKTPLTGNEQSIENSMSPLYDSLELCVNYFPSLLSLTTLDEYKTPIYKLFSNLVIRELVPAKQYEVHVPEILTEASHELKRYYASAHKTNKNEWNEGSEEAFLSLDDQLEMMNEYAEMKGQKTYPIYHTMTERYASVLFPFYETHAGVKQYIDKLFKIKDESILLNIYLMALQHPIQVPDSIWKYFSNNNKTMFKTYEALLKLNLIDKFDQSKLSQIEFCKVKIADNIISGIEFESGETGNQSLQADSLYFIEKKHVKNNQDEGDMYFYHRVNNDTKEKTLAYAYVNKPKKEELVTAIEVIDIQRAIEQGQSADQIIKEVCSEFYYKHRPRYIPKNSYAEVVD